MGHDGLLKRQGPSIGNGRGARIGPRKDRTGPSGGAVDSTGDASAIDLPGTSADLRALAQRGVRHPYRKGRLLIEEGDAGDTLYIVLSGRLRVFAADPESGREVTYGHYGPGEFVGELSLDGGPRSASVEVVDSAQCVLVTRTTLEAFIAERPAFAFELLAKVIARARAATLSARQLALNDVYGRLRSLLEARAEGAAAGRLITDMPTHITVAREIGCSREMVSRLMKDLERGGYVEKSGKDMWLRKPLPVRW